MEQNCSRKKEELPKKDQTNAPTEHCDPASRVEDDTNEEPQAAQSSPRRNETAHDKKTRQAVPSLNGSSHSTEEKKSKSARPPKPAGFGIVPPTQDSAATLLARRLSTGLGKRASLKRVPWKEWVKAFQGALMDGWTVPVLEKMVDDHVTHSGSKCWPVAFDAVAFCDKLGSIEAAQQRAGLIDPTAEPEEEEGTQWKPKDVVRKVVYDGEGNIVSEEDYGDVPADEDEAPAAGKLKKKGDR